MKLNNKYQFLIVIFLSAFALQAQQTLSIEDAIKIALKNNYEIQIASNNLKVDSENNTAGNAGMLPIVTASIIDNNNIQNLSQTRSDGTVNSLNNGKSNSLNYGIGLDWTIFDGMKMFARRDQLKELQKLGESQLKWTIITKIGDVYSTYYDIVQQQQQLVALDSTIIISLQRLDLAQNRFTIGKASKLEVLNAQVDLNTDKVLQLKQKVIISNTKVLLNQILARDATIDFTTNNIFKVDTSLKLEDLSSLAKKQNPELQAQIINKKITELQLKQVKSSRYPTVAVRSGYNFVDTQSSLGFTTQSSAKGLNYGFSASLNLFDGLAQNRNEKIANLALDNANIQIDQQELALETQLTMAYQTYLTNLELITLEETNESIAKKNLEITLDKFRIGTITTLEFRTAQLNYVNAIVRFTNAQYQAKLSEISLKELSGRLDY
ncbi:TolC family protein [Flavobacterium algicola]|uniref:TolC family protein n=1 Tax=Flavobacterium algicola TaxID=556529 RepID=UPI001EFE5603|nr:TolC family protein [Flavobacterium algicola]MCG9792732.1 TolC family protein [Flavobacterium algicola]